MFTTGLMAVLSLGVSPQAQVPSYDEAVRCAGLTQAASELEGGESAEGHRLYDAALYWSLTVMQIAQTPARTANAAALAAEADQSRARIRAVRELSTDDAAAAGALRRCRARAPALG